MLKRQLMKCLLAGSMLMGLGFAAQAEYILHRSNGEYGDGFPHSADQVPSEAVTVHTEVAAGEVLFVFGRGVKPTH